MTKILFLERIMVFNIMRTINGVYASANIFTTNNLETNIDNYAISQIQMICDNKISKGCKICIMPDVHPGKVGTIGLTMTIKDCIIPNFVGIDIGCGMSLALLKQKRFEFQKLDSVIRESIPSGLSIRKKPHSMSFDFDFTKLNCYKNINVNKAICSLGTLGSGNHFIEIDKDDNDNLYIVVHSGSRHLGKEVTDYYLQKGQQFLKSHDISIPFELTYLQGELMKSYIHDLSIIQDFAELNRMIIINEIAKNMKFKILNSYSCIHNYIASDDELILRKGAISARLGEKVIIPINMRDGIILGTGLGNKDWNYSSPHGAGRIIPRSEVKSKYTVSNYKSSMKGIYSSCINKDTLDEAPFAYRSINDICEVIGETISIDTILKPVYNYKSGSI